MRSRLTLAMLALFITILSGFTLDARRSCTFFLCWNSCPTNMEEYCADKCEEPVPVHDCDEDSWLCTEDERGPAGVYCNSEPT